MRPRFALTIVLVLLIGLVLAVAVFGFLAATAYDSPTSLIVLVFADAGRRLLWPVVTVLLLGAAAGTLGWLALFLLHRDGFHRMEWVAFLPKHYGGKSPFRT